MNKIVIPYSVFDLSGGATNGVARRFCVLTMPYGDLRKHFAASLYDISTGTGEQRAAIKRRVNHLKKAVINHTFTPSIIEACALPEHIEKIEDGKVTLNFNGEPLPVLDGQQRIAAFETIRSEGKSPTLQRLIDNLPIPVKISLDPEKRKSDFVNLNNGLGIHKAHMLQLEIDMGLKDAKFKVARELALALDDDVDSPYYDLIQFDQTETKPLNASVLMTNRKTDQIMSLFGTARLMDVYKKDQVWVIGILKKVYDIVFESTSAFNDGKLLEFPTEESSKYKAGASFFNGVVNQVFYYLFLTNKDDVDIQTSQVIAEAAKVFDADVDGDTSSKRRATLMREFAQALFKDLLNDPNFKIGPHFGIPYTMVAFFNHGCFGVDSPGKPILDEKTKVRKRGRKKKQKENPSTELNPVETEVTPAYNVDGSSDTADDWTDEF